ncbi:MAG: hypothetical protein H5T50_08740 [Nitrososphaeria archaeon]|nr:hypothetical protein [Nitrososphaeria archaeon]
MSNNKGFAFRGLEFHNRRMWQWGSVKRALDFMKVFKLNGLIFHQNDILNYLVFPSELYPPIISQAKSRFFFNGVRSLSLILNNRLYIQRVIREAKKVGVNFYLEVKEICYPADFLTWYPEVLKPNGAICTTNPLWWSYLDAKVRELLEVLPDLAGLIISPATDETQVSIHHNTCQCRRCQNTTPQEWYRRLIETIYKPLHAKGKTLVIRDFVKSPSDHSILMDALMESPKDIVISLKFAPQDYFHTFPNNPRIGEVGNHPQWVEFDCWGQFYGLGFFPCSVVEDMQKRMQYCYTKGVSGVLFRTDLEYVAESSTFNSFNLLNLIGGACLAQNINMDIDKIYEKWLEYGLFSPLHDESEMREPIHPSSPTALKNLRDFMRASWSVMEKTVYVRGSPLTSNGTFPSNIDEVTEIMDYKCRWVPGFSNLLEPTEENLKVIFEEKDLALKEVERLPKILAVEELGLPQEMVSELKILLKFYEMYVRGFQLCTHAIFLTKKALKTKDKKDVCMILEVLEKLSEYKNNLSKELEDTSYTHLTYQMLNSDRLEKLVKDIRFLLKASNLL